MKKTNNIDSVSVLLTLFIFLLSLVFYYLYKIEQSVENYHTNHNKLIDMQLLNKGFDDFSLSSSELSNYNLVNAELEKFSKLLIELKNNIEVDYPDDKVLAQKLVIIQADFEKKEDDIEYFKSLNSALISGSHFLFDLQRSISDSKEISSDTKSIVNEALFYLFQFTKSDYIDKSYVSSKLAKVQQPLDKKKIILVTNFYNQSTVLLDTLTSYRNISSDIRANKLGSLLKELETNLDEKYSYYLVEQQVIATFFFISTVIILVALIFFYMRSLKTKKELLAFNYAVQHSDNAIVMTDPDKNIVFVNEVFEKTTGYCSDEVIGENPRILKSNKQDEQVYVDMKKRLANGKSWEGELINQKKDGSLFYERASIIPIFSNDKLINYLAIKLDITEYIEQNMRLQQAASVFENTEEVIIIADENANVVSVNKAFTDIYGYTIDDVKGTNLSILHSGAQDKNYYLHMWDKILHNDFFRGKIINKTKSGEEIPVWVTIKAIRDKTGKISNYTSVQTDLRAIENSEAKAEYLAYHDPLTGLYNRVSFEEYLTQTLAVVKRQDKKLAILFIDLDRFKIINDTLGHDIGDEVLISVTKRLKHILRESDYVSRWGGDEFVVILQDVPSDTLIATVARKIIDSIKEPIHIGYHNFNITASIGISMFPDNGSDTKTLIKYADTAMYLAKESGKNSFRFYTSELSLETEERLNIDIALHSALEKNEIYVVFQPQYNLETKKIVSVETLVRWENDTLGFVAPDKFIPIAEDNGFIIELGYFIFEESCKAFKQMKASGLELQRIAINVSSIQFKEPNLLEALISIVKRHELEASEIEIEITERFLMENTDKNIKTLQSFRDYGFKISIDDFGTGYSSMSYLKQLPIDTIKIDKSFVDDIGENSSDNAIIEAIVALSKKLNYSIVAEGIETGSQEQFLESIKCDIGQGYLFSRPILVEELIARFR
ncbi:EAL domain-containing protein [Sulfurimonas marina]|uniref:EAL domain-containing protein n=1 Tax=Sulfurimonas marina TaxID=2590551 RepID=A0A7M1AUW1_9BACT|nr:EAL domain-containing protein [Sulfurimonas marina]QOP41215.1 EAL domain-containing protein [Sulfurimonas marina]